MNVEKISNPQWADKDHTAVNCMVKFEHIEQAVPFTATASDTEAYGRDIYAACLRGEAGEIAEYVQPSISPEKARELKDRTTLDLFAHERRPGRPKTNPLSRDEQLRKIGRASCRERV